MLTQLAIQNAKPKQKSYKLFDSGGLYLRINPNGSKLWQLKYRYLGKEKMLSLGLFPLVTLAEAREKRDEAKKKLINGIDPSAAKKAEKQRVIRNAENTFKVVALEWYESRKTIWSPAHADNVMHRMEADIFPYLGNRPIAEIDAPELLGVLRKIEKRGAIDIAHRVRQTCGQIFRYGIATGRGTRDHAADLKDALTTVKTKHFAALDIKEMPEFLHRLKNNDARLYPRTRRAINLLMLTFVRTTELIEASWDEIDLDGAQWIIPAERMKMRRPHIIPLSRQAVALLKEQKEETARFKTKWVFPSQHRPMNPMSNNTILVAIKNLGYAGRMTGHGFRALAMSNIKEKIGYRHEVVDRQLAHGHRNKVAAAYDRAQFLDERTKMMQEWSDYLDAVAAANKLIVSNFIEKKERKNHG